MPKYRVTVRHGRPHRYHVEDVSADTLRDATLLAAESMPANLAGADLVEIRLYVEPDARAYAPER